MERVYETAQGRNKKPWNVRINSDESKDTVNRVVDVLLESYLKSQFHNLLVDDKE